MLRRTTASVFTVFPATLLDCPAARTATFAQADLAARAVVGRAAGDHDPRDRPPAARAGLPLARVDEELVLHLPLLAAAVAVVVDRGPAVHEAGLERRDHAV